MLSTLERPSSIAMRLDPEMAAIVEALQAKLKLNATNLMRLALVRLAEAEAVDVPPPPRH